MNTHEERSKNSGFFLGFVLGMAAALLLSTKKGRRILKVLLDQGLDKIGNWSTSERQLLF